MKAREVRLGNLVMDGKDIEQVNARMIDMLVKIEADFEPIPLTEEWLLKFGFSCEAKMGGDGVEFRVYHFDVLTFNTNHGWWYKVLRINDTPLEYVHQLQNFYFALTGEELTLKP